MQPTFGTFVPTTGSRRALAAVRRLVEEGRQRLLLLYGPPGIGKSHLLRAGLHQAGSSGRTVSVAEIVDAIVAGTAGRFEPGLVVVDDLHVLAGMPVTQREVARHLHERMRAGQRILAATGLLTEIPGLADRLSLIAGAHFVAMRPPRIHEITRLLLVLAARSGIRLTRESARTMAARCRGDVRTAHGAVARLQLEESLRA